ncbi:serine hydrolase domain-containing protein [Permianibacter aggregans]|uniref:CubicO group peptidase (Beta-lactamase class C family) n=1 Tax=Permianibacter aggregans TaxID=1510150 RepID=A0A4R6UP48_9GAMM|nr:serine hydrolase domain-containing protein [Permianibacter aggregans]TDQ48741.1 CubicO group peptidase (beta-lactamase class C family) [Permianibacter aggregans]
MFTRFFFLLSLHVSVALASWANASERPDAELRNAEMESLVSRFVRAEAFRGVVLVAHQGKLLHRAAYGEADASRNIANSLTTRFLIGSLTKSFTAIAVLQLVEQEKLELKAPIARYLPELRNELAESLTLHLLLKHQSGLPVHLERLAEEAERPVSSKEIFAIINDAELSFSPGSKYEYGNLGYHLAALILERVSGKPYQEIIQQQIFEPAGMRDSGIERFAKRPERRANGYAKSLLGISQDENNVSWAFGTGDIYSTADDILRWDEALFSNRLLSRESRERLFDGESAEWGYYGYGFRVHEYQRSPDHASLGKMIRHGGSMDGFLSNYHHYIDDELTVIVLANIRPFEIRQLTFALKEVALGAAALGRKRNAGIE